MTRIEQMIQYCEAENIYWFSDLADYCMEHRKDWLETLATDHGGHFIKSAVKPLALAMGI